jgi:hypothetical protein
VSNEALELVVKVLAPWHYNKTPTPNKGCDTFERQQHPSHCCPAKPFVQSFAKPSIAKMSIIEPSIALAVTLPLMPRCHHNIHC